MRDFLLWLRSLLGGDSLTPAEYALNIQRLRRKAARLDAKRMRLYVQALGLNRLFCDLLQ
jgi:hypothetical protein